ncbi:MAG TPA: YtxH domain-containing protein [Polyangiaceae bacterium]|jgi:hypothetical protein|nr:YtxH domain-containing protein [Polyangiaceae bacterium]
MNYSKTAKTLSSASGIHQLGESMAELELDDILNLVGLERKPTTIARLLPLIGLVVVSAAVGVSAALLLAPSSGRKLRMRLSDELEDAKHRLSNRISELEHRSNGRHALS